MKIEKDAEYIEACRQHLEELLVDFERAPTIQDVGDWLVEYSLSPLPPRLVKVLKPWLEEHNDLTIKQANRGKPASNSRDVFPLISLMHRHTGLSIQAACQMIAERLELEVDPLDLRRMYDRAITPYDRHLNDTVKAIGAFNTSGTPRSDLHRAADRFKKNLEKRKNRTIKPD